MILDCFFFSGNCVTVSPEGKDEPQCLNFSTNTSCRTISYAITHGFSSVCLSGNFYNSVERIEIPLLMDQHNGINIFCKITLLKNSELFLSCNVTCNITFCGCIMKQSIVRISNIHITFRNVSMEDTHISDFSYSFDNGTNEIYFENSLLFCFDLIDRCGLYLANISSTKLVLITSYLKDFRLNISISQLILIIRETKIITPIMNVKVKSPEYLRILAIIYFDRVKFSGDKVFHGKTKGPKSIDNFVLLDLTNPYVIIKECYFTEVHLEIESKKERFEPVFLSVLLNKEITE